MNVAAILSDVHYRELKNFILNYTGLSYYTDKDEDLASRLARRFAVRHVTTCAQYLQLLRGRSPTNHEMEGLVGELTIGETYFFRQREHFQILRDTVLPELITRNRASRTLRIWSAGCASGAEPYSINILLELEMTHRLADWDVSIVATDLNSEFLARAREAKFAEWAFRETPEWLKLRCFEREGNQWKLRPEFRRRTTFQRHNLAGHDPAPGLDIPFDVILCRNVMIYLSSDLVRQLATRFYCALAPGGFLLVGHAEPNAEIFAQFTRLSVANATLYQKPFAGGQQPGLVLPDRAVQAFASFPAEPPFISPPYPEPVLSPATRKPAAPSGPALDEVRLLADRGEWHRAGALARQLTSTDPLNAYAHFMLGLILEHADACQEADSALRRAVYLDRRFALAHYHLGICQQRNREAERARKSFRNVLQLLSSRPAEETVEFGDGMTVSELAELARMHVEVLGHA
jgi:chemotaxis protein methyltransferase CheR